MSVQPETETGTPAVAAETPEEGAYSFAAMEAKWPQVWEDLKVFTPVDDGSKERRYVLDMFPYPVPGDLGMGRAGGAASVTSWPGTGASRASTCCTRSVRVSFRPGRRERRHQARRIKPAQLDLRQHRTQQKKSMKLYAAFLT